MSVTRSGRVIAIEAHPRTCEYLQGNIRLNDLTIEIHNTAIGSTHGELFFADFRSAQGGFRRSDTLRSSELTRWANGLVWGDWCQGFSLLAHLLVRPGCDISSSRPAFARLLRGAAVKGGRRPSRSDLPLTAASTAADLLDRVGS
jgi:hypothetical protein